MEQMAEQLEFELWAEETLSEYDIVTLKNPRYSELRYWAFANRRNVEFYQSPVSAHVTVRYRV